MKKTKKKNNKKGFKDKEATAVIIIAVVIIALIIGLTSAVQEKARIEAEQNFLIINKKYE